MIKERTIKNTIEKFFILSCMVITSFLLFSDRSFAQNVSESEIQEAEKQEFGLESDKTTEVQSDISQEETKPLEDIQPQAEPELVKPIEAEQFKTTLIKRSTSGKVLLFTDPDENRPRPGKVLLIKEGNSDIAAVRVLKNYSKENGSQFAAKVILPFTTPQVSSEYRVLKKLGYKIIKMIREREKRGKNLNDVLTDEELAKEISPDDNELDRGIPKPKKQSKKDKKKSQTKETSQKGKEPEPLFTKDGEELTADSIELNEEDRDQDHDLTLTEIQPLVSHNHTVSLQYALAKNYNQFEKLTSYTGFGLRYSYNLFKYPFFKKNTLQDSISPEIGLFYYPISNFSPTISRVQVYPVSLTARYNIYLNDVFSFFAYVGFIKNIAMFGEEVEQSTASRKLSSFIPAAGVGTMISIGPGWAVRAEYGLDMFAIGGSLRF